MAVPLAPAPVLRTSMRRQVATAAALWPLFGPLLWDPASGTATAAEFREVAAMLLAEFWSKPTAAATLGEVREVLATMGSLATLRCGEGIWCSTRARLRSLLLLDPDEILGQLVRSQNPADCERARYLVWHDDRPTSGFGWNSYLLFKAFLQAFLEGRVLVEAAAVDSSPRWRQHWCSDPPYSLKCYFRSWSRCERQAAAAIADLAALPDWKSGTTGSCSCNDTAVIWRASLRSEGSLFPSLVSRGRYWWYAVMVKVLMQPLPWLQASAEAFLRARGLDRRPFVVAAVFRPSPQTGLTSLSQVPLALQHHPGLA